MKKLALLFTFCLFIVKVQSQDDCSTALVIDEGLYPISEINGDEAPPYFCLTDFGYSSNYEWYQYTPLVDGSLTVTTDFSANEGLDTRFNVYKGSCGTLTCIGGDDDSGEGNLAKATFNVDEGDNYYIVFDNSWSASAFTFQLIAGEAIFNELEFETLQIPSSNYTTCIVDMNADFLDDYVTVDLYASALNINYQMEDGSFENVMMELENLTHNPNWSMAAGDFDDNGYTDLLLAGGGASFIMANNDGTGYYEALASGYIFCQRSNCVDINGDGKLDAFVCHDVEPNVYFINEGGDNFTYYQGGLSDVVDGGNYGSVWIDYDNDCDMDLFIAKCRGGESLANYNQLFRNDGDGVFTEVSEESGLHDPMQTWSSAWGDYDNDEDMDVLVGANSGTHKLMENNGDGTFTDVTEDSGWENLTYTSIEFAPGDFNNDGFVDVFGAGSFMLNNGDMTFTKFDAGFYSGSFGDLNNDGFLDITNSDGYEATAYINKGNENNYLTINTIGIESNRSAIGARITLYSPSFTQIRDVRSGEGFRHMSTLNTHFGLGNDAEIEKIKICWPSGLVEELLNPPINGTVTLVEGFVVGLNEESNVALKVYPIPTDNFLFVDLKPNANEVGLAVIYDLSGKLVLESIVSKNGIDVSAIESGFYFVKVKTREGSFQSNFIKE
jgi:ASPIC and UnbV/FG-GAP-like repeat/Secretion system C-terminal sorting domain